jgi:hypothetical protein
LFGFYELSYCLPVEDVETEIGVQWVESGVNRGAFDDFLRVSGEDAISESMTNIVCKTNKEAMFLTGVEGKAGFSSPEVNRFIPYEAKERTDINGGAGENLEGNTVIQRWVGKVIKHIANVLDSKRVCVLGRVGAVKNGVGDVFDTLPMSFGKVLVLHKGLTLPVGNMEGSEDVLNLCDSFDRGVVTEERVGASHDAGFQGIRELLVGLHTVDVADKGGDATEELSHSGSIIDSRGVSIEGVRSDVLVALRCVDSQIRGLEPFPEDIAHRNMSQLGGGLEGMLDDVNRVPEKVGAEGAIIVSSLWGDMAVVDIIMEHVE